MMRDLHERASRTARRARSNIAVRTVAWLFAICLVCWIFGAFPYFYVTWKFDDIQAGQHKRSVDRQLILFKSSIDSAGNLPPAFQDWLDEDRNGLLVRYTWAGESLHVQFDRNGVVINKIPTFE